MNDRVHRRVQQELAEDALGDVEVAHPELEEPDVRARHRLRSHRARVDVGRDRGHRLDQPPERDHDRLRVEISRVRRRVAARRVERALEVARLERRLERGADRRLAAKLPRRTRRRRRLHQERRQELVTPARPTRHQPPARDALVERRERDRRPPVQDLLVERGELGVGLVRRRREQLFEHVCAPHPLGRRREPRAVEHRERFDQPPASRVRFDDPHVEIDVRAVHRRVGARFDRAKERRARALAGVATDRGAKERHRVIART